MGSCTSERNLHSSDGNAGGQLLCCVMLQVQPLDPAEVLLLEGQPVVAGAPVLLVHCATLAPLAMDAGIHTQSARLP